MAEPGAAATGGSGGAGALARALGLPVRRPRATLLALALLALGATATLHGRGLRAELGVEQLVPRGDPLFARYEALSARFGRDDNTAFVFAVRAAPDWFTPEGARRALALTRALGAAELVLEVVGPATATVVHDEGAQLWVGPALTDDRLAALDAPALARLGEHLRRERAWAGRVVSRDGRTVGFAVRVRDAWRGAAHHAAVVAHVERALAPFAGQGTEFLVTGGPPTQHAYRGFLRAETPAYALGALLLLALALAATFRSAAGVALPLLAVGLALLLTFALQSLVDLPLNLLSSAVPVLVLVVGVSDAIHLLARYEEELAAGPASGSAPGAPGTGPAAPAGAHARAALGRALVATARACLFTSVTTSSGFFLLPATGIPMLADLGLVIGAGVVLAYLVTLTLLPAALALLPPPRPSPPPAEDPRLLALGRAVTSRPGRAVALSLAVLAGLLAAGAPRLRVESRVVDDLPLDHPVVRTRAAVEARMGGNYPLTFLVHPAGGGDPTRDPDLLARVAAFQAALEALPGPPVLSGSRSLADYAGVLWRGLGGAGLPPDEAALAQVLLFLGQGVLDETVDREGGALRLPLQVYDRGTAATFEFLARAEAAFARTVGDRARLEVQGFTYLAHRTHRDVVRGALTGFALDFALVAALVLALFRSARLTLLAVVPNVFPMLCTLGFMGLAGVELRIGSAVVFSIVFGVAVDDTVHFLVRYHEERRRGLAAAPAAVRTVATAGRAMLCMAFVLAAGFAALLLSRFSPNQALGLLMAATVASGVLGDLVLLPALLALAGRRDGAPA